MKNAKLFSCLLVLIMLLSLLAGCGKSGADAIVGTWESTVDMSKIINDFMEEDPDMAEYIHFEDFKMLFRYTFREDGTYEKTVDKAVLKESMKGVQATFAEGMRRYLEDSFEEMGFDGTVEDYMESLGLTMEELAEAAFGDDMVESMVSEITTQGNYRLKDGKLYTSSGLDSEISEDSYETYELSGNKLVLKDYHGEIDEMIAGLYPMTFKRAK